MDTVRRSGCLYPSTVVAFYCRIGLGFTSGHYLVYMRLSVPLRSHAVFYSLVGNVVLQLCKQTDVLSLFCTSDFAKLWSAVAPGHRTSDPTFCCEDDVKCFPLCLR